MKCSKTFRLTIDPAVTCPALLASPVLPHHVNTGNPFFLYSASVDLIHPNKYFIAGDTTTVQVMDADTNVWFLDVAYPAGYFASQYGAAVGGSRIYVPSVDLFGSEYGISLHVDAYVWVISGAVVGSLRSPSYDDVHGQVAFIRQSGANRFLYVLNGVTLAVILDVQINIAAGENITGTCYCALRDCYYVCGSTGGGAPFFIRGHDRATGALIFAMAPAQNPRGIAWDSVHDELYAQVSQIPVPTRSVIAVDPVTGATDATIPMTQTIDGFDIQYWPNPGFMIALGGTQNRSALINTDDDSIVCFLNGMGETAGVFGDRLGLREWNVGIVQPEDAYVYE